MGYIIKQTIRGFMYTLYCEAINDKFPDTSDIIFENMDNSDFPKCIYELNKEESENLEVLLGVKDPSVRNILNYNDINRVGLELDDNIFDEYIVYYCNWV